MSTVVGRAELGVISRACTPMKAKLSLAFERLGPLGTSNRMVDEQVNIPRSNTMSDSLKLSYETLVLPVKHLTSQIYFDCFQPLMNSLEVRGNFKMRVHKDHYRDRK